MSVAEDFLSERYYRDNEDWYGLITRVSQYLANDNDEMMDFYFMMADLRGLPSSPILMNAGHGGFMSACSYLPIEDDLPSIMDTISKAVMIQKSGGGTGFNFSKLRPSGSPVKKTNGVASGPCSFVKMYDSCSDIIKQGGKRRGANMALLHYKHKDINDFICLKDSVGLANFNLSIVLDEHAFNTKITRKIAERMWSHGEPGVVFWDNILKDEPEAEGINPCGEIPLRPYESCVLGSINLYEHLENFGLDFDKIAKTTKVMTKLLNRVIDKNDYIFPEMKEAALATRKIGIGIMGFADVLLRLGIEYGSDECLELIDEIMFTIKMSTELASESNSHMLSIAPTGSISIIVGVSSGIEPNFAWEYQMNRENGVFDIKNRVIKDLHLNTKKLPAHFKIGSEISPQKHIKVQSAFQKWVDQAISKTINLPHDTTVEQVESLIKYAHANGCKGITMFREDCDRKAFLTKSKCGDDNCSL